MKSVRVRQAGKLTLRIIAERKLAGVKELLTSSLFELEVAAVGVPSDIGASDLTQVITHADFGPVVCDEIIVGYSDAFPALEAIQSLASFAVCWREPRELAVKAGRLG